MLDFSPLIYNARPGVIKINRKQPILKEPPIIIDKGNMNHIKVEQMVRRAGSQKIHLKRSQTSATLRGRSKANQGTCEKVQKHKTSILYSRNNWNFVIIED